MAPFNMRCKTCGEYIYRGKKFNARKEDVIGKTYLGIQVYRFYIKCTKCLAEITFLTDPASQDYEMENGAIRNFESVRLAEKQAEQEEKARKEEEANNPMKLLENRTRDSRREMDVLETLEDLREMNTRNAAFDPEEIIRKQRELNEQLLKQQEEEDEKEIQRLFGKNKLVKTENNEADEEYEEVILCKRPKIELKEEPVENKNIFSNENHSKPAKLNKTNASSFIVQKKATIELKEELKLNSEKNKPLASLCAYSDDDSSDNS